MSRHLPHPLVAAEHTLLREVYVHWSRVTIVVLEVLFCPVRATILLVLEVNTYTVRVRILRVFEASCTVDATLIVREAFCTLRATHVHQIERFLFCSATTHCPQMIAVLKRNK